MQLIYNRTNNPIGSVEEIDVDFPTSMPNSAVDVTFPTLSPMNPGDAVSVSLVQPFPTIFLVPATAELLPNGMVHAQFFDVLGLPNPSTTLACHVVILAHEGDP